MSSSMSASLNLLRMVVSSDARGVWEINVIGETLPLSLFSVEGGIGLTCVVGVGGIELDRFV